MVPALLKMKSKKRLKSKQKFSIFYMRAIAMLFQSRQSSVKNRRETSRERLSPIMITPVKAARRI